MPSYQDAPAPRILGRYLIGDVLATGGMAAVHVAQTRGARGFSRVVAVKRMLPHIARDACFASMFADEARLAARVRHPNVVPTFDVVMEGSELCIVMEYVQGVTMAQLARYVKACGERVPPAIALAIVRDALEGLHAAHEAADEHGTPLGIVHRDVSPQNVLVGADGVARVLDFGIAKANVRLHETRADESLKGKLGYMAPEQLEGHGAKRASDIYAAAVVLWEGLTGERLHTGENEGAIVVRVLLGEWPAPSTLRPELGAGLDAVVLRGLARDPGARFASAREMAVAIAEAAEVATAATVSAWIARVAAEQLAERAALVHAFESMGENAALPSAVADSEATQTAIEVWPASSSGPASGSRTSSTGRARARWTLAVVALLAISGAAIGKISHDRAAAANAPAPDAPPAVAVTPAAPGASPIQAAAPPYATQAALPASAAPIKTGETTSARTPPGKPRGAPPHGGGRRAPSSLPDHL